MPSPLAELDYEAWLSGSTESAEVVVPLLLEATGARSAVDLGCGLGAWLAVLKAHGVDDVRGYDGPWVDRSRLLVSPPEFVVADLEQPLTTDRRFDLALCLETAHLLGPEHAAPLVAALVAFAPVVAFSAGIPGQGGTGHRNEQWPEYWAGLFAERGYGASDPFRAQLWDRSDVKWWFSQNLVCFAEPAALDGSPTLAAARCVGPPRAVVHPLCEPHADQEPGSSNRGRRRWLRRRGVT